MEPLQVLGEAGLAPLPVLGTCGTSTRAGASGAQPGGAAASMAGESAQRPAMGRDVSS